MVNGFQISFFSKDVEEKYDKNYSEYVANCC